MSHQGQSLYELGRGFSLTVISIDSLVITGQPRPPGISRDPQRQSVLGPQFLQLGHNAVGDALSIKSAQGSSYLEAEEQYGTGWKGCREEGKHYRITLGV